MSKKFSLSKVALDHAKGMSYKYGCKKKSRRLAACHGQDEPSPDEEDCFIQDQTRGGYSIACGGKYLCTVSDFNDAMNKVNDWKKKHNFFPNLWLVDDHGGAVLIDKKGNKISGNKRKGKRK